MVDEGAHVVLAARTAEPLDAARTALEARAVEGQRVLADELGRSGINVTVVHPGMTVTERTPAMVEQIARARAVTPEETVRALSEGIAIGRLVTAAEVADVVTFLASPRSVAITGDAIAVGGGARGAVHC